MNDIPQADDILTMEKDIEDLERLVEKLHKESKALQEELFDAICLIERLKAENDLLKDDIKIITDKLDEVLNLYS